MSYFNISCLAASNAATLKNASGKSNPKLPFFFSREREAKKNKEQVSLLVPAFNKFA